MIWALWSGCVPAASPPPPQEEVATVPSPSSPPCPPELPPGAPEVNTVVLVQKADRWLGVYRQTRLLPGACWPIALAGGLTDPHLGTKLREGDRRTPEGVYALSDKPSSSFRGAVAIHYPNRADADRALAEGRLEPSVHRRILDALARGEKPPQQTPLGGEILFHGGGSAADWTLGCIALEDDHLASLRRHLAADWSALAWIRP